MPHSFGKRARTRDLFSKPFRKSGVIPLSTYLVNYKVGQYVDIVTNPSQQRGLPYKYYHGKTGTVFNVSPHSVGVNINKQVRNRILKKRIYVRIEHVRPSKCQLDAKRRVRDNDRKKREAKANGGYFIPLFIFLPNFSLISFSFFLLVRVPISQLKRQPRQPKDGYTMRLRKVEVEDVVPLPYEILC